MTTSTLSAPERAVKYVLDRIRQHPDLRRLMLGTQGFALLCEAEASRTGGDVAAVEELYSQPTSHPDANKPSRLKLLDELTEAAEVCAEFFHQGTPVRPGSEAANDLIAIIDKVRDN